MDKTRKPERTRWVTTWGSSVLPTSLPFSVQNAPDLQVVVEAWPTLADALKRAILALVNSAGPTGPE
jgi:hypothetical protein